MTFHKNCTWQSGDEEMEMKILRKGDNKCKGPEAGFCLVYFKNREFDKTKWRRRLVENEKIQKTRGPDCVRLYKPM